MGTRLITSAGDSALGGVYKLVALQDKADWLPAIKLSESRFKTINPGNKQAWRIYDQRDKATADLLSLDDEDPRESEVIVLHHSSHPNVSRKLDKTSVKEIEPLLIEILKDGELACEYPSIQELRTIREKDVERLDTGVRRLMNPHIYHVSLTPKLWELKHGLIESVKVKGN